MSGNVSRLVDLIRVVARRQPAAPAIEFEGGRIGYAELYDDALRLANGLREGSFAPGDAIGILAGNSPDYFTIYLACQLAGLVAVPINYRAVADDVAYVLGNCAARGVFVGEGYLDIVDAALPRLSAIERQNVIVVGSPRYRALTAASGADDLRRLDPLAPAAIFYTSGTTGFPKGAMMSHLNVLSRLVSWGWEFGLNAGDVVLVPGPVFHMSFSSIALVTLAAGGRVVLMRDFDAKAALDLMARFAVTWSFLVPKMTSMLIEALGEGGNRGAGRHLRGLLSSGSPLPQPLLEAIVQSFPQARITDAYGWTETGWVSLCHHEDLMRGRRSVGRAAFGCELGVLDREGRELAPGEVGEIYAAPPLSFLGYYGNPAASAAIRRGKWETGGDMGYLDAEGYLHLVDRKNDMIISGGENIYPAEIERVLLQHPKIFEVTVVGVPDEKWGESPRACVVLHSGENAAAEEIIGFCDGRLARYKRPRSVDFLEALPRNAMGKVLRRELRERYWQGQEARVR
ncbi:MAG: AMP-binding protein [Alphaproteobacteria bacterium]|nr:AMP-binding protein [Alphaproteobacteria bacterium]MBV8410545.1 AMP-binding protein [Alphaproteobacteria bacterium]